MQTSYTSSDLFKAKRLTNSIVLFRLTCAVRFTATRVFRGSFQIQEHIWLSGRPPICWNNPSRPHIR
jgi:hypothetical protein